MVAETCDSFHESLKFSIVAAAKTRMTTEFLQSPASIDRVMPVVPLGRLNVPWTVVGEISPTREAWRPTSGPCTVPRSSKAGVIVRAVAIQSGMAHSDTTSPGKDVAAKLKIILTTILTKRRPIMS